jgi:hypothetical protein
MAGDASILMVKRRTFFQDLITVPDPLFASATASAQQQQPDAYQNEGIRIHGVHSRSLVPATNRYNRRIS